MYRIFTPYRVCPLGAHVDHQCGFVTGFAIDRGVSLEFKSTDNGKIVLTSKNYPGIVRFNIDEELERESMWGDFAKSAVYALKKRYKLTNGLDGVVEGTLPIGGLSSSASVILTYINALCRVNGISLTRPDMINFAILAEREFIGVNVGKLDQSCEVYCKKDSLMYLDTKDDSVEIISKNQSMPDFEIMIAFCGKERKLAGSAYNTRVDECKAAAYALMAYEDMEYGKYEDTYLRDVPYGVYVEHKDKLPDNWKKRAEHYYSEQRRVKDGIKAWREGNLEAFGKLISESGHSSIENYETGSIYLKKLQDILDNTEGVYGSRFSGAGFNGSSIAIVNPQYKQDIVEQVTQEYISSFPQLKDKFSIHFCKTADGVEL